MNNLKKFLLEKDKEICIIYNSFTVDSLLKEKTKQNMITFFKIINETFFFQKRIKKKKSQNFKENK